MRELSIAYPHGSHRFAPFTSVHRSTGRGSQWSRRSSEQQGSEVGRGSGVADELGGRSARTAPRDAELPVRREGRRLRRPGGGDPPSDGLRRSRRSARRPGAPGAAPTAADTTPFGRTGSRPRRPGPRVGRPAGCRRCHGGRHGPRRGGQDCARRPVAAPAVGPVPGRPALRRPARPRPGRARRPRRGARRVPARLRHRARAGQPRRGRGALALPRRRTPDRRPARQRLHRRPGPAAAARLGARRGRGDQPPPAHRAGHRRCRVPAGRTALGRRVLPTAGPAGRCGTGGP